MASFTSAQDFFVSNGQSKKFEFIQKSHVPYTNLLAPVVQRMHNAFHRINHYPVDSLVCLVNTYPLDRDLSGG